MGLLAGALGGAANAVYDIYDKKLDREGRMADRRAELDYAAELAEKKQIAEGERKTRLEEELRQRQIAELDAAEKGGRAIGDERDQGGLLKYGRGLGGTATEFTDEEKDTIRNMPEAARKIYEESGALSKRTAVTDIEDAATAARNAGAHSTVLDALATQRKNTVERLKQEFKEALDIRKQDDAERRTDAQVQRAEAAQTTANAAVARAGATASKDDDKLTPEEKSRLKMLEKRMEDAGKAKSDARGATAIKAADAAVAEAEAAYQAFWDKKNGVKKPEATDTKKDTPKQAGGIAKPTSQAEFDKLPKGAKFVNPKDGKTYIKN